MKSSPGQKFWHVRYKIIVFLIYFVLWSLVGQIYYGWVGHVTEIRLNLIVCLFVCLTGAEIPLGPDQQHDNSKKFEKETFGDWMCTLCRGFAHLYSYDFVAPLDFLFVRRGIEKNNNNNQKNKTKNKRKENKTKTKTKTKTKNKTKQKPKQNKPLERLIYYIEGCNFFFF